MSMTEVFSLSSCSGMVSRLSPGPLMPVKSVQSLQYRSVQYSSGQYRTAQYSTGQYSTIQNRSVHSAVSTVQVSTVQYSRVSTFQYSTVVSSVNLMSVSSSYLTMSPQDLLLSSASVSELLILGFVAELTDRLFLLELELDISIEMTAEPLYALC